MAKQDRKTNPVILKQGMKIGGISAETDEDFLLLCFQDYPAVEQCMNVHASGMIIDGRTGAGKTAILRYIQSKAEHSVEVDPTEMSMSYVSNSDALNFLHAIGADLDLLFQVLWKHVLCIEFIRLRFSVDNEEKSKTVFAKLFDRFTLDARKRKSLDYLREFEGKFWITMDQNIKEITEKVENKLQAELGGEISKFKARGQYEKQLSTGKKSELVARARKIINAEQLAELNGVIDILSVKEAGEDMNKFYILIDKLDDRWVSLLLPPLRPELVRCHRLPRSLPLGGELDRRQSPTNVGLVLRTSGIRL
jgi:ABC-type lipoprotein export system ATPase subunit